jgi:hypothetical protein
MKNRPEIIAILTLIIFSASIFTKDLEIIKIAFATTSIALSGYFSYLQQPKS